MNLFGSENILDSYNKTFYEEMSESSNSSARILVPLLQKMLKFESVIDIGCGDGQFVAEFMRNGISRIKGVEGSWILDALHDKNASWLIVADLTDELIYETRFDLAICLEVAEHLDEKYSDVLVKNLVNASDLIFFSAAIPGQGGTNHVNLQYPDYWAAKFAKFGYFLEWDPRNLLGEMRGVAPWYQQNCLLYKKSMVNSEILVIPKTIFHPEIFPRQQSFSYKLCKFPVRLVGKIRRLVSKKR